ncbi:ECF transporter S component [Arthrobacter sp. zg-Y820]|uniref:general stress protein n=1 Tax=unclassified Arthrobacter TaxID=235627 RepID=UPI001E288EAF|nr:MULTISPECIES: general stress protein [unclassified Arthrobacter]MCC9195921.1 ECF transporter S component [Arthrobacter sp. zg-Y820]MDK1278780.1 ECF transporter S component [Arthrobacter sp. zg.Y820]WIB08798.1 ECF transporter S component [Arthrobacter sp. zg-Y820]
MSNLFGSKPPRDEGRSLPQGETVGRYTAYLDAQKAVDYLADSKFPVQMVSIIGNELKSVERVTGSLSYPKVALSSAATGAWFGLFVGLALMLFAGGESYLSLIPSMALGAAFWLLFGVLAYAMQRGRRDFTSISQVVATSYDVIVAPQAANDARRLLQQLPMIGQHGHPQPPQNRPPYQGTPPYQGQTPPQGGQGAAPDRPASWANPYGAATGQPQAPAGQPDAGQQGAGGTHGASAAPDSAGTVPRGQFPDLPDGRPQYGVRLPPAPEAPADSADSAEPQQNSADGQNSSNGAENGNSSTGSNR